VGSSLRLEYNQEPEPGTNWVPLATFVMTNTSQRFLDTSPGAPSRRYRAIGSP
jgi:hypothetical protein